jgi:hypothetical protein
MSDTTVTTAAAFIPEIWSPEVMYALKNSLEFRALAKIEESTKGKGDKVHMGRINFGTARDKTANSAITFDATTDTDVTITLDKDKYKALLVNDIAKIQSEINLLQAKVMEVSYPVAKAIDLDIVGLYSSISASVNAGAATASTILGKLLILKRTLDAANAPRDGRVLVVEPYTESILLETDKLTSSDYINQGVNPLVDGAIGRIIGFDVVPSNNIQTSGGYYQNMAFVKNRSLGMAISKDIGLEAWRESKEFSDAIAAHAIYGVGILENDSCCILKVTVPAE